MKSNSTKTDPPATASERILVGIVRRPHGVRGAVAVELRTDNPDRFRPGAELELVGAGGRGSRRVRVESTSPFKGGLRVSFEGVTRRDEVEGWRGATLEVERSQVPPPPAGEHYLFELIGCRCRDRRVGELGRIIDLIEDGGGWLVVVERPDGGRLPIPYVERFLARVDAGEGVLEWDLPEGLIEACVSAS